MLSVVDAPKLPLTLEHGSTNNGRQTRRPSRETTVTFRIKPNPAAAISLGTLVAVNEYGQSDPDRSHDGTGVEPPNWQYAIQTINKCILNQRRVMGHPLMTALPWTQKYPHLMDYYSHNAPDYTGMGLYAAFAYPNDHRQLLRLSPDHWTAQVMISEFAKSTHYNDVKLLELRGRVYRVTNKLLNDPVGSIDPGTVQFIVALIAVAILSSKSFDDIKTHFHGIKSIFDSAIAKGRAHPPWLRQLVEEQDSITSVLSGQPLVFPDIAPERRILVSADHPFRVAMYPLTSNLSRRRWQAYMLTINGSGCQTVFRALFNLRNAVVQCFDPPHRVAPQDFLHRVAEMESVILMIGSTPGSYTLNHPAFSSYDADKQAFVVETLRLVALVLLHIACHTVRPSSASHNKIDTSVQMALKHVSIDESWKVPAVSIWAWLTIAPFTSPGSPHEETACSRITAMAPHVNLAMTFDDIRRFLFDLYFIPQLQDGCIMDLWQRIGSRLQSTAQPAMPFTEMPATGVDTIGLPLDPHVLDCFNTGRVKPIDSHQSDAKAEKPARSRKKARFDV